MTHPWQVVKMSFFFVETKSPTHCPSSPPSPKPLSHDTCCLSYCELIFCATSCIPTIYPSFSVFSSSFYITNSPLNSPLLCTPYPIPWPNRPHLPFRLEPVGNHIMPSSPFQPVPCRLSSYPCIICIISISNSTSSTHCVWNQSSLKHYYYPTCLSDSEGGTYLWCPEKQVCHQSCWPSSKNVMRQIAPSRHPEYIFDIIPCYGGWGSRWKTTQMENHSPTKYAINQFHSQ